MCELGSSQKAARAVGRWRNSYQRGGIEISIAVTCAINFESWIGDMWTHDDLSNLGWEGGRKKKGKNIHLC